MATGTRRFGAPRARLSVAAEGAHARQLGGGGRSRQQEKAPGELTRKRTKPIASGRSRPRRDGAAMSGVGNPLNGQNVNYVAVARLADRCVVAHASHGAHVDQSGVRSVLDPAQMRTVDANKHYNFETSGVAWHLESDGAAWIYVAITSPSYPLRHAAGLLRDLRTSFQPKAEAGLNARGEGALNNAMSGKFQRLCAQYDDLANVDSLHATLAKVETVKVVMQDSIELALQNCVSLEAIDQKADELQSQAGMFKSRAKTLRKQMWWKKCKMQMLIAFIILTIIGVIVVVILAYTGQFDKKKGKGKDKKKKDK